MWLTRKKLPTNVVVNNHNYAIETDFRAWMLFECILFDISIERYYKPAILMNTVLKVSPLQEEKEQIMDALFSFYRMDKPIPKQQASKSNKEGYRFDVDMDLIYAAFLQQYQIDLLVVDLHWWQFKSLFEGLTKKTKFIEVVGYRTMDTSLIKDKIQKKKYEQLQAYYALPKTMLAHVKTQEEIEASLLQKIERGGE